MRSSWLFWKEIDFAFLKASQNLKNSTSRAMTKSVFLRKNKKERKKRTFTHCRLRTSLCVSERERERERVSVCVQNDDIKIEWKPSLAKTLTERDTQKWQLEPNCGDKLLVRRNIIKEKVKDEATNGARKNWSHVERMMKKYHERILMWPTQYNCMHYMYLVYMHVYIN